MSKRVAILGGGVAGLSAAHELVRRGYEVDVYEARADLGGKARSQNVVGTGTNGRADLPGEHGFRFYPAFYKHLIQTMTEIPLDPSAPAGPAVSDNLRACREAGVAIRGSGLLDFLRRKPAGTFDVLRTIEMFFGKLHVDPVDMARFVRRILRYLASCKKRRADVYERTSWWSFLGGDDYKYEFQRYLRAVPRIMVAMDPQRGSALTIGNISMQLMADYGTEGTHNDRTLVGPTTAAWIGPWQRYLERCGVRFHLGRPAVGLDFDAAANRITAAHVAGETAPIEADHYVLAAPLEAAVQLVSDALADRDPELAKLRQIRTGGLADTTHVEKGGSNRMLDWMVGIQFFLREDVPLVAGHVFYPDSPWALSSISQAQFWRSPEGLFRDRFGDGRVGGVLSVDVSDWNHEGILFGKPAKRCTADEIRQEIWAQLKAGLNRPGRTLLEDDLLACWQLDQDIHFPEDSPSSPVNRSPLLVHPPGSWQLRPTAETGIDNLVLASDYVRTDTNLACMEGANEAARRAVNGILRQDGYSGAVCALYPLEEDPVFDRAKSLDEIAYTRGRSALTSALAAWRPRGSGDLETVPDFSSIEHLLMDEPDARSADLHGLRRLEDGLTGGGSP